jgi:TRAP-type C4-dicarboxylate transport system permease small subunit
MLAPVNRLIDATCRFGLQLGAASTAGIFLLLAGSSIRRYALGSPLSYTEELAGLLFVVTSFAAVPFGVLSGRHIRLLLVWRYLAQPWASWFAVVGDLLAVAIVGLIVVQMVAFAEYTRQVGARTEISELLLWPWMYVMPLALSLLALALAWRALMRAVDAGRGRYSSLEPGATPD